LKIHHPCIHRNRMGENLKILFHSLLSGTVGLLTTRFPNGFEGTLPLGGDGGRPSRGESADTTYPRHPCVPMASAFHASEPLAMTWKDVDLRRRIMTVRTAYAKNGESHSVPMNEVLTDTLQAVRMDMCAAGSVFRTRRGNLYRSFRTVFTHAVRQTCVMNFTFARRLVMRRRLADRANFDGTQGHQHDTPAHPSLQRS
jgi:hypothetical protein